MRALRYGAFATAICATVLGAPGYAQSTAPSPAAKPSAAKTKPSAGSSTSMDASPAGALPSGTGAPMTAADSASYALDSAANASPLSVLNDRYGMATDSSAASGLTKAPAKHDSLAVGTKIQVQITDKANSKDIRNGQVLKGTLVQPIRTALGQTIAAGTPVVTEVVAVAPAGRITSFGEITLQVIRVGSLDVLTDYFYAKGEEGHKDLPDSAPEVGTEATLDGKPLNFTIPKPAPPPTA